MAFDATKAIQAVGVVLRQHKGRASRLRILKILYIAEREVLQETLLPLLGDPVVAMEQGPVQSHTYDLLRGRDLAHWDAVVGKTPAWNQFIEQDGPRDHVLINDPGVDRLSRYEYEKLVDVCEKFWFRDDYDIALLTHQFPEWVKNAPPKGGSRLIPIEDVLSAIGHADYIQRVKAEAESEAELDRLFGTAG